MLLLLTLQYVIRVSDIYTASRAQRNLTLDLARTFAIVLMVIFHFIYDLKMFNWVDWNIPDGDGWKHFRWVIISLFFLCLGLSLSLAHQSKFRAKKFARRVAQIAGAALLISVATWFAIPQNWIFFGVLHFLAVASLICVAFVRMPKLSFAIGLGFMLLGLSGMFSQRWPFHLLFDDLPAYTNDYVAIIPWLGVVFFGISLAHTKWFKNDPLQKFPRLASSKALIWPGQHSLSIYLLHQPILIGLLYLVKLIF
jgi:uncharacterized membrane protein